MHSVQRGKKILLITDTFQAKYAYNIVKAIEHHTIVAAKKYYDLLSPYEQVVEQEEFDAVIFNNERLLKKLIDLYVKDADLKTPNLNTFQGSVFLHKGTPWVCLPPAQHLHSIPEAQFMLARYVDKLFMGYAEPELKWERANENTVSKLYDMFKRAILISVDIETNKDECDPNFLRLQYGADLVRGLHTKVKRTASSKKLIDAIPTISMVGYTGIFINDEGFLDSYTVVLDLSSMEMLHWIRKFNRLEAPKVTQNGGYEATYFIRFNAPLYNWTCDTFVMMHAWVAECPRKLWNISAMFCTRHIFWKDEADTNKHEYNAKDCHATAWSWIFMSTLVPEWAKHNYYHKFRMIFPNVTGGLDGFKIDFEEQDRLRQKWTKQLEEEKESLEVVVCEGFNSNSSQQVLALMNALVPKTKRLKSSDKKDMQAFSEMHPLNELIVSKIKKVRESTKKLSTYIDVTDIDGRLLFEINSSGTDTGRASSKASNLWCGTQVQNIDNKLRSQFIADDGWILANCDGSQAESRTTGYLSQDTNLITTVETAPDFHCRNASMFFGIPEKDLIQLDMDMDGNILKVHHLNKIIRNLAKRVNHGANYNMGPGVLIETMGMKEILHAKEILHLPRKFRPYDVATYLLHRFEQTYPRLKNEYYDEIIDNVNTTHMLIAPDTGLCSWTRLCFNYPISRTRNKPALNSYVAHPSQNLSAMILDNASFDFWYEYQIKRNLVRYVAQIHDEVVYKVKTENYPITKPALAALMSRPVEVHGRVLVIPNDGGGTGHRWSDLKD